MNGRAVIETSQIHTRKYSPFGKQIVIALVNRNMTAKELADALGTTPQYLNKIIHGERSGEKYMEAIKSTLNISA